MLQPLRITISTSFMAFSMSVGCDQITCLSNSVMVPEPFKLAATFSTTEEDKNLLRVSECTRKLLSLIVRGEREGGREELVISLCFLLSNDCNYIIASLHPNRKPFVASSKLNKLRDFLWDFHRLNDVDSRTVRVPSGPRCARPTYFTSFD